jgi:hypothetical protein
MRKVSSEWLVSIFHVMGACAELVGALVAMAVAAAATTNQFFMNDLVRELSLC